MKKNIFVLAAMLTVASANAQNIIKETFDTNSLNWNECVSESEAGTSIIDKGTLTLTSNGINKFWSAMVGTKVGENTYFTCFCYAPLNMQQSFKVKTNVTIDKLGSDKCAGLIFNYKDNGNFYAFIMSEDVVSFIRYIDNNLVGSISQSIRWTKKRKAQQEWVLESDNSTLTFSINGMEIMKTRYMPLQYSGFGYYTFGKQKLVVDDVEFIQ